MANDADSMLAHLVQEGHRDGQDESVTAKKGLLGLPPELREQIYELLVVKPTNTITMLSNHGCYKSEVSASQPALSRVSHQLRDEVLPRFYSNNAFLAEVSHRADLAIAQHWLQAIGDVNVGCLRHLMLCGWTRVPFGHMVSKRWVKVVLDLKEGTMEVQRNATEVEQHPHVVKAVDELKASFREMVEARKGTKFDGESVGSLLHGFHGLCVAY